MPPGSTPPRRRAPQPPSSSRIPLIALFLGVMVAGLGIGAALSLLGRQHGAPRGAVSSVATAAATDAPVAETTPAATEQPAPAATRSPRAAATPHPEATAAPVHTSRPPAVATSLATPLATPVAPIETASPAPAAVSTATAAAARVASIATLHTATAEAAIATAVPYGGDTTMSAFSHASADVVRQFLQSLIDGDEATARDTMVDGKADLPEAAILDKDSRIRDVVAHGTDATSEVTLVIVTPGGNYAGRYFLVKSPAGNPQIRAHDLSKL